MDLELRILLRRYMSSSDPEDAVKVANMLLRYEDTAEVKVWVTMMCAENTIDNVRVFTTEEEATKEIARAQLEFIKFGADHHTSMALFTAEHFYNNGNYKELDDLFTLIYEDFDVWFEIVAATI